MKNSLVDLAADVEIARPAAAVWNVVADYRRDPDWRAGVTTMAPVPPAPVTARTTTAEVLRAGGRTYRNSGAVTSLDPGARFTWRTTAGADVDADGSRSVEPLGPDRCRVRLELRVRPRPGQRLLTPVLRRTLRRGLAADLGRLRALAEGGAGPTTVAADARGVPATSPPPGR
jgi:uncharacterized membrane protein